MICLLQVGPGTGVAPFRSFLEFRQLQHQHRPALDDVVSPSVLYFGCRNRANDFYFSEQVTSLGNCITRHAHDVDS